MGKIDMNFIFMIGNGFDLNCGLKSRYKDVYEKYTKTTSNNTAIEKFKHSISNNIDEWADFEMAMAEYAGKCATEDEFVCCLRDFKAHLNDYLAVEEKNFFNELDKSRTKNFVHAEMFESLADFYKKYSNKKIEDSISDKINMEGRTDKYISFNYTHIFDELKGSEKDYWGNEPEAVIHIHGELGERRNLVLGVDNVDQIQGTAFTISKKIKRAFVKPLFNKEYDDNKVQEAQNIIANSDVICTYGMSLGVSDLTWKNQISSRLLNNSNAELFVYVYEYMNKKYLTEDERMDAEDEAQKDIMQRLGIKENQYNNVSNRVHVACGMNIFDVRKYMDSDFYKGLCQQAENANS